MEPRHKHKRDRQTASKKNNTHVHYATIFILFHLQFLMIWARSKHSEILIHNLFKIQQMTHVAAVFSVKDKA